MIEVALFVTKKENNLRKRLEYIKEICNSTISTPDIKKMVDDFSTIYSTVRNIESEDLPQQFFPDDDWEHIDTMTRETAPGVGDTIILDCGEVVEVIHVTHQWDHPELVQVMARRVEQI